MANPLSNKQKKFCEEYIIDFNGTQAAIRAGYSEKTANPISAQNLAKLSIQSYVQELMKQREKRTEITADMVVKELAKVAFLSIDEFLDNSGEVKALNDLSDNAKGALSSYSVKRVNLGEGEFIDVPIFKMHDKIKSLELLGKHLGLFEKAIVTTDENNQQKVLKVVYE